MMNKVGVWWSAEGREPCEYPDWRRVDKHEKRIGRRESRATLKKNPISRGVVEAATGSVPFRLHARTSSQAVLFRPYNAGERFERGRTRPFSRRHHQPCRTPPSTSCYSSRPDGFAPTTPLPKKKGGLILGEESIVGKGKKKIFIKFSSDNRRISRWNGQSFFVARSLTGVFFFF